MSRKNTDQNTSSTSTFVPFAPVAKLPVFHTYKQKAGNGETSAWPARFYEPLLIRAAGASFETDSGTVVYTTALGARMADDGSVKVYAEVIDHETCETMELDASEWDVYIARNEESMAWIRETGKLRVKATAYGMEKAEWKRITECPEWEARDLDGVRAIVDEYCFAHPKEGKRSTKTATPTARVSLAARLAASKPAMTVSSVSQAEADEEAEALLGAD